MTNSLSVTSARLLVVTGFAIASVLAFALPTLAQAATYAYVNQQGNIATFVAATPWIALVYNVSSRREPRRCTFVSAVHRYSSPYSLYSLLE